MNKNVKPTVRVEVAANIKELKPGESGYTLPWAVTVYQDGSAEINGDYPVYTKPGGTACLYIRCADAGIVLEPTSTASPRGNYGPNGYDWRVSPPSKQGWGTPLPVLGKPFANGLHGTYKVVHKPLKRSLWQRILDFLKYPFSGRK